MIKLNQSGTSQIVYVLPRNILGVPEPHFGPLYLELRESNQVS